MAKKIGRRLIADVFDLAFKQNGKIAITSETLTDAGIDFEVTEKEITGGRGNGRIATLYSNRKVNVKATDPVFDYNVLALNLGQNIVTGAGVGYQMKQKLKVTLNASAKEITLAETPIKTTDIEIYHNGTQLETSKFTVSAKKVTITDTSVNENDLITVMPYSYMTAATAEKISITSDTYAEGGELVLETLEIDDKKRPVAKLQYIFYNATPSGKFSVNTKSERDAAPTTLEFAIDKPEHTNEIGYIIRIPITEVV